MRYLIILFTFISVNAYSQSINDLYKFIGYDFYLAKNNLINLKFTESSKNDDDVAFVFLKETDIEGYAEVVTIITDSNNIIENIRYFNNKGEELLDYMKVLEKKNGFIKVDSSDLNYSPTALDDIYMFFINKENIVLAVSGKKLGVPNLSFYKLKK